MECNAAHAALFAKSFKAFWRQQLYFYWGLWSQHVAFLSATQSNHVWMDINICIFVLLIIQLCILFTAKFFTPVNKNSGTWTEQKGGI